MRSTFLVVGGGAAGHALPLLSLVEALSGRGHRVLVCLTGAKFADGVAAAGGELVTSERYAALADAMEKRLELVDQRRRPRNPFAILRRLKQYRAGFFERLPGLVEDLEQIIARERVDCVVAGMTAIGARYAAERAGIPFATQTPNPLALDERGGMLLSPSPLLSRLPPRLWHELLDRMLPLRAFRTGRLGLPPLSTGLAELVNNIISDELCLVTVPAFFYPSGKRPRPETLFVGPMSFDLPRPGAAPFPVDSLKPGTVLVSTTTMPMDGGLFRRVLEAVAPMNTPVLATAAAARELPTGLGEHVRIEPFVPHGEVLPHVSALVTHGGWGTVGRALRLGVPMLVLSLFGDQPLNGRRLRELGVAYHLPGKTASPEAIRDALSRLLADDAVKQRARALAEELKALDSRALVADALESLVARRGRRSPRAA